MAHSSIEHRRSLNVFVLACLCMAVVISLRNLPVTAEYGLSSAFFYLFAAIAFMIPSALISAELASGWPKAGGVYIWVREALGDRWAFFAVWMQWFHNMTLFPALLAFMGAGVAYVINPELAESKPFILTVILVGFWGVTFINFLGVKTSALFTTLCILLGVIIPGSVLLTFTIYWLATGAPVQIELSWRAFFPDLSHFSNLVFLAGMVLALAGLEANANLAREVKHPQKNFPRAIFAAAIVTVVVLLIGSLAIAIVIPKDEISFVAGVWAAFRYFFDQFGLPWLMPIVAILTVLGALGELNAWAIAGVRGLFATTEHGALPPFLHHMNKHHTPTTLLVIQAIFVSIAGSIFLILPNVNVSFWILSALTTQMYLLMYLLLFITGIVLRYKKPNVHRVYRVGKSNASMWSVALVGILTSLFAFVLSFIPPREFGPINWINYELILGIGFLISCALPLIIHALRKECWQREVLDEIRKEIHDSIH